MQAFWERICVWDSIVTSLLLGLFRRRHTMAWLVTALAVLPVLLLTLAMIQGQAAAREFQAVPLHAADLSGSERWAGRMTGKTTEAKRAASGQVARQEARSQAHLVLAARLVAAGALILPLSFLTSVFLMRCLGASQRRERRLSALLDASPEPLALADPHGRSFYGNSAFRRLHGLNLRDDLSARSLGNLWPPAAWSAVLRDGVWEGERDFQEAGGQAVPIAQALTSHQTEDGALDCISAVTRDLTERCRYEEALDKNLFALSRRSRQVVSLLDCLAEGFLTLDEDWRVTLLNEAAEQILGKTRAELLDQVIWEIFPELAATPLHVRCHLVRIDEHPVEFEAGFEPLGLWLKARAFPSTLGLSLFLTDITHRIQAEQQRDEHAIALEDKSLWLEMQNKELETQKIQLQQMNKALSRLATVDGLTTLKNRRTFHEGLGIEVRRARRHNSALSLLLLDLDRFPQYSAEYGSAAGDVALQIVSRVVKQSLRETDLAARYGGSTFALLLLEADAVGSTIVAERVQTALARADWRHSALTVSIGVSVLDDSLSEPNMLLAVAADGVRRSKAAGGNRALPGSPPPVPVSADQPALLAA